MHTNMFSIIYQLIRNMFCLCLKHCHSPFVSKLSLIALASRVYDHDTDSAVLAHPYTLMLEYIIKHIQVCSLYLRSMFPFERMEHKPPPIINNLSLAA